MRIRATFVYRCRGPVFVAAGATVSADFSVKITSLTKPAGAVSLDDRNATRSVYPDDNPKNNTAR